VVNGPDIISEFYGGWGFCVCLCVCLCVKMLHEVAVAGCGEALHGGELTAACMLSLLIEVVDFSESLG